MQRTDKIRLDGFNRDDSGFLVVNALPTRSGVFTYINADGSKRRELRHPDDVFKPESMATLKGRPVTDLHPRAGKVTSKNAKGLMVGYQTDEVTKTDDNFLKTKLTITDEDMIRKVESGQQVELSCGYHADMKLESGEFNGEHYDYRQTNIKYNHIATVPRGRAGAKSRIYCDSAEDAATTDFDISLREDEETMTTKTLIQRSVAAAIIGKDFKLDVLTVKLDEEVMPQVQPILDRVDSLIAHAQSLQDKVDSQQGTIDELKTKADASVDPVELNKLASERADILGVAGHVGLEGFDSMTNADLKKAVVVKRNDGINLDDKADAYIEARYDAVIEVIKNDAKGFKSLATLARVVKPETPEAKQHQDNDDKSPREKYLEDTGDMYKETLKTA